MPSQSNWTMYRIFLAFLMLVAGSINTLSAKWADRSEAKGVYPNLPPRKFDHPFLQGNPIQVSRFNPFIFYPPALCDMCATSIMYVGLNLTFASSFQMLRGSVMIFTALLSVAFLGRKIRSFMWFGMVVVLVGLVLVGLSDVVFRKSSSERSSDVNGIISGDLLICAAQIVTASQMVYEEKFVMKYNVPALLAVGFEGLFGLLTLGLLLIPFYYIKITNPNNPLTTDPHGRVENSLDAFAMMGQNSAILVGTLGNMVSIAVFNFAGISVTKELSATTRMVLDSMRTLVIWIFSLSVKWRPFDVKEFFMQLAGFAFLIMGMIVYNNLLFMPWLRRKVGCRVDDENHLQSPFQNEADESERILQDENLTQYGSNNTSTDPVYS
ncbi:DgyrCDS11579 [Dimorphilus gyrociliatus]|uniref:DgyrCDS11579 n=1 Tax=Dimorphilus gyrociliatus TaxID=2664684 RepID=A0A7I8W5N0_9ANNE|nr:DgyrCDS11579 [Dimorphilus gyrociliatus]